MNIRAIQSSITEKQRALPEKQLLQLRKADGEEALYLECNTIGPIDKIVPVRPVCIPSGRNQNKSFNLKQIKHNTN